MRETGVVDPRTTGGQHSLVFTLFPGVGGRGSDSRIQCSGAGPPPVNLVGRTNTTSA